MADPFIEVVSEEDLRRRVSQLGEEITSDFEGQEPILVGVLTGSVPFLADLVRSIDLPIEVDLLALTRFGEGNDGRVGIELDVSIPMEGRDVIIVEDIVDTGLTLSTLLRNLELRDARSLTAVALLDKAARRIVDVPVRYRGFEVGDEFLLGYGLDWEGRFRNLRSLWAVMDLAVLTADPGAFSEQMYGVRIG